MDDKQINMIKKYYNMPAKSKLYWKECGCAIDAAAEEHFECDENHSRLKILNIILFAATAVLSIALIICAHIITVLK